MREILIAFCEDGFWDIRGGDDQLTAKLLANDELQLALDDAQDIINDVIDDFEEAKQ